MSKINEILTSIIIYCIVSFLFSLNNLEYGLILTLLASQINILLPENYKHTLIWYIPLSFLIIIYPSITFPIMIGYTSSIFISLLSKKGCKLLYPLREQVFVGSKNYLETGTKEDYAATTFLVTLVIITLLLSFNGTEIIDEFTDNNNIGNYFNNKESYYNESPGAVQYININPAYSVNKNITTIKTENTTTTLITEYKEK